MFERELNRYWKTVVDAIQDGLVVVDTRGIIAAVNKALLRITGYDRTDRVGKPCSVLHCDNYQIARDRKDDDWCVLFRTGFFDMRKGSLLTK